MGFLNGKGGLNWVGREERGRFGCGPKLTVKESEGEGRELSKPTKKKKKKKNSFPSLIPPFSSNPHTPLAISHHKHQTDNLIFQFQFQFCPPIT